MKKPNLTSSKRPLLKPVSPLAKTASAAMKKVAKQVAAENKRWGLPLIAVASRH